MIDVWLRASIEAHDFVNADFWEAKVEDMREIYVPNAETYVFQEADRVLGFISLMGEDVAALFVCPAHQGKGVGSALIDRAKSLRSKLQLSVYKANAPSVQFYLKKGFRPTAEQVDENTGAWEVRMQWSNLDADAGPCEP